MAAASSATQGAASSPAADPLNEALRAAAVHAAALALSSAVQHLQRTTMLVEAATGRALLREVAPPGLRALGKADADGPLAVGRAALAEAVQLVEAAQAQARAVAGHYGGT